MLFFFFWLFFFHSSFSTTNSAPNFRHTNDEEARRKSENPNIDYKVMRKIIFQCLYIDWDQWGRILSVELVMLSRNYLARKVGPYLKNLRAFEVTKLGFFEISSK